MNPLVVMAGHDPAVVKCDLPGATLKNFLADKLVNWVLEDQAFELLPGAFTTVNLERTGVAVRIVTETTITFDE